MSGDGVGGRENEAEAGMAKAYYNEHDPHAAQWLRNLIAHDLIAPGDVDERSIEDVKPTDLTGYVQCHFFAGIGVWSYALRQAGWPDSRPVWTGSCPCFPAGTFVMTRRGQIPIERVVVGDEVLTHQARWRRVSHTGSDWSECVRVQAQGHFGIETTPEHPFLASLARRETSRRSASYGRRPFDLPSWRPAHSLKGAHVATVASVPESEIPLPALKGPQTRGANAADVRSVTFARFLGYWVGDGWACKDVIFICGGKQDRDLLKSLMADAGLPASLSAERTTARARCGSRQLAAWLREHFGEGAENKSIPAWLHGAPEAYRTAFLEGYWLADGHAEIQPRGFGRVRRFTTVSRALAIGVRILLNQSKISASITAHAPLREVVIEGRAVSERPFFRVTAYEHSRSFRFTNTHGWGLVRSVEHSSVVRRVFNLAVDDDESYVADGFVVHNCQPFSAAGKGGGFADERHLWPAWHWLIRECRPCTIFGEQVASKDGLAWFDLVRADLQAEGYAGWGADLCAASIGAPHIRQRLFFVADSNGQRRRETRDSDKSHDLFAGSGAFSELADPTSTRQRRAVKESEGDSRDKARMRLFSEVGDAGELEQPQSERLNGRRPSETSGGRQRPYEPVNRPSAVGVLGDANEPGLERWGLPECGRSDQRAIGAPGNSIRAGSVNGFWSFADWIGCTDGKWRPIEPGSFPLAPRAAFELGRGGAFEGKSRAKMLKGYGNAIVAPLAAEFIRGYLDYEAEQK